MTSLPTTAKQKITKQIKQPMTTLRKRLSKTQANYKPIAIAQKVSMSNMDNKIIHSAQS